jgi:hypothetical protein
VTLQTPASASLGVTVPRESALGALDAPQQRRYICLPDPNPGLGKALRAVWVETAFTVALTGWWGIDTCVMRARIASTLLGTGRCRLAIVDWRLKVRVASGRNIG